ncbi:endonuclease/exonuclease/phosphatase family protein [Streptomyces filamentosus]|uniref:Endonuclease/exonuclease/phosphatase domain-containing protein n=1 Tax=Streptomyces filamentosus TaxID=67294 RepID=A0A919EHS6_STRFL|nr:endonuclease/exonuclease/phosphatase family protein [Streptomyces filamentosus]GHF79952.1 hypothetical protein GCM10017667_04350 [Streptomyces filamentosus]
MRKTLVAGALAMVALLTNVTGAAASAQAEPEAVTYTAWTWNISGHKMNQGRTDNGLVEEAVGSIRRAENAVDFVSFNEICHSQYRSIRTALASWNPDNPSYARFQESIPAGSRDDGPGHASICGGESFGKAIFSRHELGKAEYRTFAQESGLFYLSADDVLHPVTNGLLCAPLVDRPNMKFCSVHISPVSRAATPTEEAKPYGYRQLAELRGVLDGFAAAGQTYMVAGDFNAEPYDGRLNQLYAKGVAAAEPKFSEDNYGAHRELDDLGGSCPGYGEPTSNTPETGLRCGLPLVKIDMIFVRADRLASGDYTADARTTPDCTAIRNGVLVPGTTAPCSDHRVLIGRATLLVDPPAAV